MLEYKTIESNAVLPPAQDYYFLREEGIKHLERLGHNFWTDFNDPDPGITILESVCYALTEMAYRTNLPIKDLLSPERFDENTWKDVFYSARQLLHSNPVTINDFRKVLIDIPGVRNAWLEISKNYEVPVYVDYDFVAPTDSNKSSCGQDCKGQLTLSGDSNSLVEFNGLYNVLVEYEENINDKDAETEVREEVIRRLHKYRNLGEDYINIISVNYQDFSIDGNFVLHPGADPQKVLAEIFFRIFRYFTPSIKFYTIEELQEKGFSIESIFEGPALQSGFIDEEELAKTDLFRDMRLSDILNELADIPGLRAITHLRIPRDLYQMDYFANWINELREKRRVARLDIYASKVTLCQEGGLFVYGENTPNWQKERIRKLYNDNLSAYRNYRLKGHRKDLDIPRGKYRELNRYVPIQNDLPHIFGLHPVYGMPAPINDLHKHQVKQLRAYLLLFEQLLANHLEQVAHLRQYFSFNQEVSHTSYFRSLHREIQHLDELLITDHTYFKLRNDHRKLLDEIIATQIQIKTMEEETANLQADVDTLQDKGLKQALIALNRSIELKLREINELNKTLETQEAQREDIEEKIAKAEKQAGNIHERFAKVIGNLLENPQRFQARRNQTLDHLLARFGEDASGYHHLMSKVFGDQAVGERLIGDKIRFLQDYIRASRDRGKGFNYGNPANLFEEDEIKKKAWNTGNISGLERRIARILGFPKARRAYLCPLWIQVVPALEKQGKKWVESTTMSVVKLFDKAQTDELLFTSRPIKNGCCVEEMIQLILQQGEFASNYSIKSNEQADKEYFQVELWDGDDASPDALGLSPNVDKDRAKQIQAKLMVQIAQAVSLESMHLVEHILLRPKMDEVLPDSGAQSNLEVKLLHVCLDECDGCGDNACCIQVVVDANGKSLEIRIKNPLWVKGNAPDKEFLLIKTKDDAALVYNENKPNEHIDAIKKLAFKAANFTIDANKVIIGTKYSIDLGEPADLAKATKIKAALLPCFGIDPFKIRVSRLPKDKCYNDEPWALEVSLLADPQDPNSNFIQFYRQIPTIDGNIVERIPLSFIRYERLTAHLEKIRIYGAEIDNYAVVTLGTGNKASVILLDDQGARLAQTDYVFANTDDARTWYTRLQQEFAFAKQSDCKCRDYVCNHNEDPYSFRCTIVLPCWSKRFRNPYFRAYAERIIRLETPAHIEPRIVWLGMESMRAFEEAFYPWSVEMIRTNGNPELATTNALVDQLNNLQGCSDCADDCKAIKAKP